MQGADAGGDERGIIPRSLEMIVAETERLKLVGMATGSLVAPPKLTIKLMECTNAAQAAYAQASIHELHVPDYREEAGSPISPAALKDVLMRTADMAETLGIDTL